MSEGTAVGIEADGHVFVRIRIDRFVRVIRIEGNHVVVGLVTGVNGGIFSKCLAGKLFCIFLVFRPLVKGLVGRCFQAETGLVQGDGDVTFVIGIRNRIVGIEGDDSRIFRHGGLG